MYGGEVVMQSFTSKTSHFQMTVGLTGYSTRCDQIPLRNQFTSKGAGFKAEGKWEDWRG